MNSISIPLPRAVPGREYIIESVDEESVNISSFHGYGLIPGSKIKLLFRSPSKNPAAYEVMGAVLALRHEDSGGIFVSPL